ncbi:MAG: ATP synthase F1 subunit epsilon [Clostridiales bacterium]|nr:ATP synthase F1 subunit epsilon [Clostridiales bacterium]
MAETKTGKINLVVVTPYKTFYEGKVDIITIPALDGELGIMKDHSPLVAALKPGICRILNDGETKMFSCSEGYAEIGHKVALVICNSAEWAEDISITRIVRSYKDATKKIEEEHQQHMKEGVILTSDATNMLARSKARMHLIELAGSDSQKSRLAKMKADNGI